MPTLTPLHAAQIAEGVYRLQTMAFATAIAHKDGRNLDSGVAGRFAVGDESRVTGTSGLLKWRPLTGFGFVAVGIGAFKDEALIALRGTNPGWVPDVLTDLNASSIGGVHTGFATTWATIKPQVDQFFRGRRFKTIHCIGHSLGAALATLAALHCAESGYGAPELYTFGSPRVGLPSVAQRITSAIGASRIHRVAHVADPVPMIPRIPYQHVPTTSEAFIIGQGGTLPISIGAHSMTNSYLTSVEGVGGWGGLTKVNPAASQRNVEQWIGQLASGQISAQQLNERDLQMLGQSMSYALNLIGSAPVEAAGGYFYGAVSALDFLSESHARYERGVQHAAQRIEAAARKGTQATARQADAAGRAIGQAGLTAGRAIADGKRVEMEMQIEQSRQLIAAAKAIYVFAGQQARWVEVEAKQGAKAAVEAHVKAVALLDEHVYQRIARMANQAVAAAK